MSGFKSEYKRAVDRLEPDSRLLEGLRADMKAAAKAPPKGNFFVRYGWVFGSAAACLAVVLAVSVFFALGSSEMYSGGGSNSGGAAMNEAAQNGAEPESADGEMAENAPINADVGENAADYDGNRVEPDDDYNSTYGIITSTVPRSENAENNTSDSKAEYFDIEDEEYTHDVQRILHASEEQIEALKPLTYEELRGLVMIEQSESSLILSDISLYDYIDVLDYDVYYAVLRYERDGVSLPVVAAARWLLPSDSILSLKLYFSYDDAYSFIDLMQISAEELDNCLLTDYWLILGYNAIPLVADEVRGLRSVSDEMMAEWVEKAKQGTLTYGDLEKSGHIIHEPSERYECYTMGSLYNDESTGRSYAIVSCYLVQSAKAAPAYVILRDISSGETIELLHEYYRVEEFLS